MADPFIERVADRLAALPGVLAVHFGGSRATGTAAQNSDWDCSLYYRDKFDVAGIRALGWPGTVTEIGGWGPVMNGGGWVSVEGQAVDIHYRDLTEIDRLQSEAAAGRFTVHRSPFFVAGIPTYAPLAELAAGETLRGDLPVPEFPEALRRSGSVWWRGQAEMDLGYAAGLNAISATPALGLVVRALIEAAQSRLCHRGQWVTNEKRVIVAAALNGLEGELMQRLAASDPVPLVAQWMAEALDLSPFSPR